MFRCIAFHTCSIAQVRCVVKCRIAFCFKAWYPIVCERGRFGEAGILVAALAVDFDTIAENSVPRRLTLTQMRRRKLLSMTELGKQAGVAASTIMAIEKGAHPRLSTIGKLSRALECEPTDVAWPGDPLGEGEEPEGS